MFLKCSTRRKDGKTHWSWSIVESRRVGRHVVQKHLFYLGEVTDRQRASWERRSPCQHLRKLSPGLMPGAVLEKLASIQLLDVRVSTTDGRELLLVRRTEPDKEIALYFSNSGAPFPRTHRPESAGRHRQCSGDFQDAFAMNQ